MSRNNTKLTAHCKVCQDAGKSEEIYRSHFIRETRDPNSRVICPTLLSQECRFCFKKGHTTKYCSTLKENERNKQQQQRALKPTPQKPAEKPKPKPVNQYACLDSDSEEEDQKVSFKPVESFPQLCAPTKTQHQGTNYAAALLSESKPLAKPAPNPEPVANSAPKLAPWVSKPETYSSIAAIPVPIITRNPRRCWADDSDSEDEEDKEINRAPLMSEKMAVPIKIAVPVLDEDW